MRENAEPFWKQAERLIDDCELGAGCGVCPVLRGLLDERLSVRRQAVRETVESLGQSGWLKKREVEQVLATLE